MDNTACGSEAISQFIKYLHSIIASIINLNNKTSCWSPIVSTEGTGCQYNYLQSSKYISIPYEVIAASQWITCEQNTHTKHTIVVIVVVVNKYYDQWILTKTRQFLKLCMVKGPQLCEWEKRKKQQQQTKQKTTTNNKKNKKHFNSASERS